MENHHHSITSTKPLPRLPPEIVLKILNMAIDSHRCLIREFSGRYHCEGFQEETTAIYTRGHPDQNGRFSRGRIEYLPLQHRCIYDAPVAEPVPRDFLRVPGDSSWDDELWRKHVATRMHVLDETYNPPIFDNALIRRTLQLSRVPPEYTLTESNYFDLIPFRHPALLSDQDRKANSRPFSARLTADDPLLECQHIRHLMLKKSWPPRRLPNMGDIRIDASDRMEIMGVFGLHMYLLIENALLVDWALMTNLETLFIDLNGMPRDISRWHDHHQPLIREMAKHLNLKTLVVAGAPVSLDIKGHLFGSSDTGAHRDMTSEELTAIWVGILEDNAGAFYNRNYVHIFMECLRPGGQLHLMFDTDPFDRLWPRVGRIEGMDFDEDPSSVDYVSYRHIIRAP